MRLVIALGGNALLRRGEMLSAENQRSNLHVAVQALLPLVREHDVAITHGNGPQVGLLALQSGSSGAAESYPLDVLDAETEGMIGYLIEQELSNLLGASKRCAALLTQIEVDAGDPAFQHPSKPIGPIYDAAQAALLAKQRGWRMAHDGAALRRVVASPRPLRILELGVIELLLDQGVVVICAGGGGIPVRRRADGSLVGVEAVIDKDSASALLAQELRADALLLLTDVDAVYADWSTPQARPLRQITPRDVCGLDFAAGSMGPKIAAACDFVERTGGIAGIGRLQDAAAILAGQAGTLIAQKAFQ